MEETGCEIIGVAPTTATVKGQMKVKKEGRRTFGSLFTDEEENEVSSQCNVHFCQACRPCS